MTPLNVGDIQVLDNETVVAVLSVQDGFATILNRNHSIQAVEFPRLSEPDDELKAILRRVMTEYVKGNR